MRFASNVRVLHRPNRGAPPPAAPWALEALSSRQPGYQVWAESCTFVADTGKARSQPVSGPAGEAGDQGGMHQ